MNERPLNEPATNESGDAEATSAMRRYFDVELREASVRFDPSAARTAVARPGRMSPSTAFAALAVFVVVAVAAGAVGLFGRAPGPAGSPAAIGHTSPAPSFEPPAVATPPAPLPATVDGKPVLRVASVLAAPPPDDREFLVGGWVGGDSIACLATRGVTPDGRLLRRACANTWLQDGPYLGSVLLLAEPDGIDFVGRHGHAVVVRAHTHDPLAVSCKPANRAACEQAVVVDAIVWTEPLLTYHGEGFSFDYPAAWHVISGSQHWGLHGPTVVVAVGTGDFDIGCKAIPAGSGTLGGVACGQPSWQVPDDGVVLAYHVIACGICGGSLDPSPAPGAERVTIGGRPADLTKTAGSMVWRLDRITTIEARFGAQDADLAYVELNNLINSWHWEPLPAKSPFPTQPQP